MSTRTNLPANWRDFSYAAYGGLTSPGQPVGRRSTWNTINNVIGSPAGQAVIGAVGAGLANASQERLRRDQLAADRETNAAALAQRGLEARMDDERARDFAPLQARRLGEAQDYLGKQALRSALFSRLFGAGSQPLLPGNPATRAAMGTAANPRPAADPLLQAIFSPRNMTRGALDAVALRDMDILAANPYAGTTNLRTLAPGFDRYAGRLTDEVGGYAADAANRLSTSRAQQDQLLQAGLEAQAAGNRPKGPAPKGYEYDKKTGELKKKGRSWWKRAALIGGNVALAVATGGASIPWQIALNAGAGAATGALSGGGWKGALTGAAIGAGTAGIGSGLSALGGAGRAAGAGAAAGRAGIRASLANPQAWKNALMTEGSVQGAGLLANAIAGRTPPPTPYQGPVYTPTARPAPVPFALQRAQYPRAVR